MKYRDYAKGSSSHETGDFVAVCADSDGWFWRNLTAETVAIALETSGADSAVKRVG